MYRIGIIGTENSHALAFSRIINLPDPETGKLRYPDVRVAGVYGPDEDSAKRIMDEAGVDFIARDPEEFHGKVEAMCVTCRKGSLHYRYALPFVEKGMPVFVDKPFTSDVAEGERLIGAAKKSGAKLCGGSSARLVMDVVMLKNIVRRLSARGEFISASLNYAADPASEYDGFYFYSPHLTEIALEIFGNGVKSILTTEKNGSRISIWRYPGFDITLNYTKDTHESGALIFAKNCNIFREIDVGHHVDISLAYALEVEHLVRMIRTGEMPSSYEDLLLPVKMISAVEESVKTGREVFLA
ncbi:MAG: Gfo/Idh/MocA family oxidoreductase [Treponema sp.]|jgi:predicted dehydrogenase|nr:Gfo/Idh/MocA family oxidoreductase [Treponema sp.]